MHYHERLLVLQMFVYHQLDAGQEIPLETTDIERQKRNEKQLRVYTCELRTCLCS